MRSEASIGIVSAGINLQKVTFEDPWTAFALTAFVDCLTEKPGDAAKAAGLMACKDRVLWLQRWGKLR